jgi:hypothetical protein
MAPFFPSWLGRGTSRRACFIGGGVPGAPETSPGLSVVALFDAVFERKATLPARKGSSALVGLAVHSVSSWRATWVGGGGTHLEEPLRRQTS